MHRLERAEARTIAVRAQLLDAARPDDLLQLVRRLTLLQLDPTAAVAPSAHLVAWSRLGDRYQPEQLTAALEDDRTLVELDALVRPMEDLRLFRAAMVARRHREEGPWQWVVANEAFRQDVLARLRDAGPLLSRDIPDTCAVSWASTGWTNNRNVTQMLEFLILRGEVAIAGRRGRQRVWDLAERVYPADGEVVPAEEAQRLRNVRRLRALGIARAKTVAYPMEPADVGEAGEPATVDGVPGEWRVDPAALDGRFEGRTALLSPFDRLLHDRVRARELFDFEYQLEMYKPKEKRRWGYFALPVLHADRLVGKLDVTADRKGGRLVVNALHEDVPFTPDMRHAVDEEIENLAGWLGLSPVRA